MVLLGVVSFMLVFSMMGCLLLDIAVVIVEPSKEYVASGSLFDSTVLASKYATKEGSR